MKRLDSPRLPAPPANTHAPQPRAWRCALALTDWQRHLWAVMVPQRHSSTLAGCRSQTSIVRNALSAGLLDPAATPVSNRWPGPETFGQPQGHGHEIPAQRGRIPANGQSLANLRTGPSPLLGHLLDPDCPQWRCSGNHRHRPAFIDAGQCRLSRFFVAGAKDSLVDLARHVSREPQFGTHFSCPLFLPNHSQLLQSLFNEW
jgi:hypothetical protein